ncbi:BRISC and BRCA1-A complex member 1-like, partial [Phymastichus coffea]|uniref:BRISC and BRCA1-A complex member 1-like n=1 Tax=Phymastichus coffea TaxID=108790 RepID=UPI00273C5C51
FSYNKTVSMDIPLDVAEKIILVIDTVIEPNSTGFKTKNGDKYNSLLMTKRISEIFIHNKLSFNLRNEFAIMTLDSQNVNWHSNFKKEDIIPSLDAIKESNVKHEKYFNIQPIFNIVHQQVSENKKLLDDYVVRVILLYTRSNIIPRFNLADSSVQELIKNSNFYFDVLYIHELNCQKHKCEEIYIELKKLDIRNTSYIMEVSRDAVGLHNLMGKFLAHPKQRVPLKQFNTAIHPMILKAFEESKKKAASEK